MMVELDSRLENDTVTLGELRLCRILLMNDSQYPWVILVPRVAGVSEIHQLTTSQRALLAEESNQVSVLLASEFNADKMNIAALGNVVSQLHIHHVARYKDDAAWPAPIWGVNPVAPYSPVELEGMVSKLKQLFQL